MDYDAIVQLNQSLKLVTKILRIDASSRFAGSHSRELTDYFQTTWLEQYPQDEFIVRDIINNPLPHLTDTAITGFYTPQEQLTPELKGAIALSDALIAELQSADILLLSVPMYNFSVPSALKAWIDQIVRIGRTFAYDGTNFAGLVEVKKAYIICAYGSSGFGEEEPMAAFNFLNPYLKGLFSFLGVPEIDFFNLQGTTADRNTVAENTTKIKRAIEASIKTNQLPMI